MRTQAGLLALAFLLALPAPAPGLDPAAIAAFARHPLASDPDISPHGTWFAAVRQEGRKRSLVFTNLATGEVTGTWSPPGYSTIGTFYWANDQRVVVELADEEGYLAIPVSRGELYAVDVNGRGGRMIFGYRAGEPSIASRVRHGVPEQAWGRVIDTAHHDDRHVLVAATSMREVGDRVVRLYQLDVYSGVTTFVTQSPMPEAELLTDEAGRPRIAFGFDASVKLRVFYRGDRPGWRELGSVKGFTRESLPVGYVARDRTVLVVEPVPDGFGLLAVSIDDGARKLVARTEVAPPRSVVLDHATRRVVAVEHEPDLPVYQLVDPAHPLSRALRRLQAAHPDEHVRLVARSDDDAKAMVLVYGDRDPGRYLVVDVGSASVRPAAEVRPWIRPEEMSPTAFFHMAASDGFRIHGYLTSPRTARRGTPPPLVVLLHGGPHSARDTWGFDPEVQLLASDGYAVLQVNYRGSGGYGLAYQQAGYRRWGDRVVEDVVDAVRRTVALGLADPGRICTYGSSFGAYAALQAAVVAPDLFRCAVGDAGVYDLGDVSSIEAIAESELGRGFMSAALGDDPAVLRAASPALNADAIRARVLLVHGEQDRRAPIEQAERMRDALRARGKPVEWHVEPREGHGFYDEGARARMYAALLRFLAESNEPGQAAGAKAAAAPPAP
jgi:dipeptidyl aminopeptidase/acylaminoacyl peptidase